MSCLDGFGNKNLLAFLWSIYFHTGPSNDQYGGDKVRRALSASRWLHILSKYLHNKEFIQPDSISATVMKADEGTTNVTYALSTLSRKQCVRPPIFKEKYLRNFTVIVR